MSTPPPTYTLVWIGPCGARRPSGLGPLTLRAIQRVVLPRAVDGVVAELTDPEGRVYRVPATRSPDPASTPERGTPAPVESRRSAGALSHATTEA